MSPKEDHRYDDGARRLTVPLVLVAGRPRPPGRPHRHARVRRHRPLSRPRYSRQRLHRCLWTSPALGRRRPGLQAGRSMRYSRRRGRGRHKPGRHPDPGRWFHPDLPGGRRAARRLFVELRAGRPDDRKLRGVPLGTNGSVTVIAGVASTEFFVDVTGYYPATVEVASLNGASGALTIEAGTNVTVTPSGSTITIASTGGDPRGRPDATGPAGTAGAAGANGFDRRHRRNGSNRP